MGTYGKIENKNITVGKNAKIKKNEMLDARVVILSDFISSKNFKMTSKTGTCSKPGKVKVLIQGFFSIVFKNFCFKHQLLKNGFKCSTTNSGV